MNQRGKVNIGVIIGIIAGQLVILVVLYFLLIKDNGAEKNEEKPGEPTAPENLMTYTSDQLSDMPFTPKGSRGYWIATFAFEYDGDNDELIPEIEKNINRIRSDVYKIVSQYDKKFLMNETLDDHDPALEGMEPAKRPNKESNHQKLCEEIRQAVNARLETGEVWKVFIESFTAQ